MTILTPYIPNPIMLIPNVTLLVERSWKERFFSFPWRPIEKWKPDPRVWYIENVNQYYAHPETIAKIKQDNKKFREDLKNC